MELAGNVWIPVQVLAQDNDTPLLYPLIAHVGIVPELILAPLITGGCENVWISLQVLAADNDTDDVAGALYNTV